MLKYLMIRKMIKMKMYNHLLLQFVQMSYFQFDQVTVATNDRIECMTTDQIKAVSDCTSSLSFWVSTDI